LIEIAEVEEASYKYWRGVLAKENLGKKGEALKLSSKLFVSYELVSLHLPGSHSHNQYVRPHFFEL